MSAGRRIAACVAPVLAACSAIPAGEAPLRDAAELAAAESAFAAQSVRDGMRAAFLQWLAPGATLFRGGPVDGIATIAARPDPPVVLDWRPVYVETASSGEIGLSTGPWKLRARDGGNRRESFGQFISVWRRDTAGNWRVHVDLGISHPEPSLWDASLTLHRATPPAGDSEPLEAAEGTFADRSRDAGARAAYAALASGSIRGYREGVAPVVGREAFLASEAAPTETVGWEMLRAETSRAGDFGFTLGRYGVTAGVPAGHFLRVWRREAAGWRIALDITEPLPTR